MVCHIEKVYHFSISGYDNWVVIIGNFYEFLSQSLYISWICFTNENYTVSSIESDVLHVQNKSKSPQYQYSNKFSYLRRTICSDSNVKLSVISLGPQIAIME